MNKSFFYESAQIHPRDSPNISRNDLCPKPFDIVCGVAQQSWIFSSRRVCNALTANELSVVKRLERYLSRRNRIFILVVASRCKQTWQRRGSAFCYPFLSGSKATKISRDPTNDTGKLIRFISNFVVKTNCRDDRGSAEKVRTLTASIRESIL